MTDVDEECTAFMLEQVKLRERLVAEKYQDSPHTCPLTYFAGKELGLMICKCLYGGWFALSAIDLPVRRSPEAVAVVHRKTGFMVAAFPNLATAKRFINHVGRWHADRLVRCDQVAVRRLEHYVVLLSRLAAQPVGGTPDA